MELNKRVKGKDNLKDRLITKSASPNNEQLELTFFFHSSVGGSWREGGGRGGNSASTCQHVLWLIEAFGIKQPQNGTL